MSRACSPNESTISCTNSPSNCAGDVASSGASRSGGTSAEMIPSRWTQVPPMIAVSK